MIDLSDYSCDKCTREFSRHCKHCLHTAEKPPTRFKPKKKTGVQTPEYRRPTLPPNPNLGWQPTKFSGTKPPKPPTSGSNAQKPPNVGSSVQHSKQLCPYETPCGYCTKWDKKCDKKIPERGLRAKDNFIDDAADFSYGKCLGCGHYGWHMPQCAECNPENGFKYFDAKENNK